MRVAAFACFSIAGALTSIWELPYLQTGIVAVVFAIGMGLGVAKSLRGQQ